MKASPVQLKGYLFTKINVQPREEIPLSPSAVGEQTSFDWTGVNIRHDLEFGWADGQEDDLRDYAMRLCVTISNTEGKPALYDASLEVIGYFDLIGDIPVVDRKDIANVNGASLLFGVIREMLFSLTARFPKGPMVLPGVNFYDLLSSR